MFNPTIFGSSRSPSPFRAGSVASRCRFCTSGGTLFPICACPPPYNLGHIDCLVRAINSTVSAHCGRCGQQFRGVYVSFTRPTCREWIRHDDRAKYDLVVAPLMVLYLYYWTYLGHIHYVTNVWLLGGIVKYLIVNLMNFTFVAAIMSTFLSVLKLIIDLQDWRRRNTDVLAIPLINEHQAPIQGGPNILQPH